MKEIENIQNFNQANQFFVPPTGPPTAQDLPSRQIYGLMGEENIFKMLEDFYMELEKSEIRRLFPKNMQKASRRNALFFVQILGGPPLYSQARGEPKMRERHLPFKIDEKARLIWISCFHKILESSEKYNLPKEHLKGFKAFLERFSLWMVNQKE